MEQHKGSSSELVKKTVLALAGLLIIGVLATYSMRNNLITQGTESDEESKTEKTLKTEDGASTS